MLAHNTDSTTDGVALTPQSPVRIMNKRRPHCTVPAPVVPAFASLLPCPYPLAPTLYRQPATPPAIRPAHLPSAPVPLLAPPLTLAPPRPVSTPPRPRAAHRTTASSCSRAPRPVHRISQRHRRDRSPSPTALLAFGSRPTPTPPSLLPPSVGHPATPRVPPRPPRLSTYDPPPTRPAMCPLPAPPPRKRRSVSATHPLHICRSRPPRQQIQKPTAEH
jgi:hypothetical protein